MQLLLQGLITAWSGNLCMQCTRALWLAALRDALATVAPGPPTEAEAEAARLLSTS